MGNNIWFIILTLRPEREEIQENLTLLSKFPVVIVDNTPNNSRARRLISSNIALIQNGQNLGYTGGMNVGINYALSQKAQWLVLLNDDVELDKHDILKLTQELKKAKPGIVGPFPGKLDKRRWATVYPISKTYPFDYLSGSFLALHKNVIEKTSTFYRPYFIYYEDVELCLRAKWKGFPLVYIDLRYAKHSDASTFGQGSLTQEYYLSRNHLIFVERNAPLSVKLYETLRMPKTLWEYYKSGNRGALLGVRDYALRKFGQFKE